jgi:hypothetical protein
LVLVLICPGEERLLCILRVGLGLIKPGFLPLLLLLVKTLLFLEVYFLKLWWLFFIFLILFFIALFRVVVNYNGFRGWNLRLVR